jgi:hypothetical protein
MIPNKTPITPRMMVIHQNRDRIVASMFTSLSQLYPRAMAREHLMGEPLEPGERITVEHLETSNADSPGDDRRIFSTGPPFKMSPPPPANRMPAQT